MDTPKIEDYVTFPFGSSNLGYKGKISAKDIWKEVLVLLGTHWELEKRQEHNE